MLVEPPTIAALTTLPAGVPPTSVPPASVPPVSATPASAIQSEPSPATHPVEGAIGYFDLADWWLTTFSAHERERMEWLYHPHGVTQPCPLTHGREAPVANTAADLLASLATWLYRPQDRPLARRVLAKAGERAVRDGRILELHYTYQVMIQIYYRDRQDPAALQVAIEACGKMIALAPQAAVAFHDAYPGQPLPRHYGYHLLTMIRERQQEYRDAIHLARVALSQGWDGDWPRRLETYKLKLRLQQASGYECDG